jgi:hypothetical protein
MSRRPARAVPGQVVPTPSDSNSNVKRKLLRDPWFGPVAPFRSTWLSVPALAQIVSVPCGAPGGNLSVADEIGVVPFHGSIISNKISPDPLAIDSVNLYGRTSC